MPVGHVYEQAALYCAAFNWPLDDEVDWLIGELGPTKSVVEPFCGQARYGPTFAARGIDYVGFDRCREMLAQARPVDGMQVVRADARAFELGRRFDLAWCPVNSICHLHQEAGIVSHLECVRRHLEPGGCYVVELELFSHDGPWTDPLPERSSWTVAHPDGGEVEAEWRRLSCDLARRIAVEEAHFEHRRDGVSVAVVRQQFQMRMWTAADLVELIGLAGFEVESVNLNRGSRGRPRVSFAPHLENGGENLYIFLRPVGG